MVYVKKSKEVVGSSKDNKAICLRFAEAFLSIIVEDDLKSKCLPVIK